MPSYAGPKNLIIKDLENPEDNVVQLEPFFSSQCSP